MPRIAESTGRTRAAPPPPFTLSERAVTWPFLCLLAAAPVLRAGDTPWAWTLIAALTGVILLLWGGLAAFGGRLAATPMTRVWPAIVLYMAVVLWAVFQATATVPEPWHSPLWEHARQLLDTSIPHTLSLDSERSLAAAARLLCYGGVFVLAFQIGHSHRRALLMLRWIVFVAVACTAYGVLVDFIRLDILPWPKDPGSFDRLASTFPDRNTFSTYSGMTLIAAVTLLFRPKVRSGDLDAGRRAAVRNIIEYLFTRSAITITATAVLFCAVLLTHSRGGLAVAALGLGVFLITVTRSWRNRRSILLAVVAFSLGFAAIFVVSGGKTIERMASASGSAAYRGEIYRLTAEGIAEASLHGTGYGTFPNVFAAYPSEVLLSPQTHGFNIYLENALELGVPATAALVVAVLWIGLLLLGRARRHGRESYFPGLGVAIVALVASHSLIDSTLRAPGVAVTFAALLGIASSQTLAYAQGIDWQDEHGWSSR